MCGAGTILNLGQQGRAQTSPTRGGVKQHQTQIGVGGQGKAKGQFRHPDQGAALKQAQPVRCGRVTAGRAVGEKLGCFLAVRRTAVSQQPIIVRAGIQPRDSIKVGYGVKRADQLT